MKRIDNMVDDSVEEKGRAYITEKDKNRFRNEILQIMGASSCLVAATVYSKLFPGQDVITGLIYLAGTLIVGIPILAVSIRGFIERDIKSTMEILVSIAMIMSMLNNQYVLATLIPIVLTFVHFLEEKSIMGGNEAIEGLKKLQSKTALLCTGKEEKEVPAETLRKDDVIIVKPGMGLPIDGIVIEGTSSMDQKSLTGESIPKTVTAGDNVYAGTINIDGVLRVKVEKELGDTSFQRIVNLLENAGNITIPETRIIDQFMLYYIPLTLTIATFVWVFSRDITRAVAILVVSCPCGFMLASTSPVLAALGAAAKRGILIKNAAFIEKLADVTSLMFDKTGTITVGDPVVYSVELSGATSEEEILSLAASAAHNSLHPVSKAVVAYCEDRIEYDKTYELREFAGKGVKAVKEGTVILWGNKRWLTSLGYELPEIEDLSGALSWVVKNDEVMGCVKFHDIPREDAPGMVKELKELGIGKITMLTGDNRAAAERIKAMTGIDSVYAELLPEQKMEKVKESRKNGITAVVGDGINDALALSDADIGIAMGAMGSDTAISSADISLMNNNLTNIPFVIALSRKTKDIIYQNIMIVFLMSFIMIAFASFGLMGALAGAFLHNLGAFIVLLNSGRLLKFK